MRWIYKYASAGMPLGKLKYGPNELGCCIYSVTMGTINSLYADFWFLLADIIFLGHLILVAMYSENINQDFQEGKSKKINLL